MSELTKLPEEALLFIANTAMSSYMWDLAKDKSIAWYDSRFGFQKDNLANWFVNFNPSIQEQDNILRNPVLHKLFGYKIMLIQNELYEDKLKLWSTISKSTCQNSDTLDQSVSFIKIFENLSIEALKLLQRVKTNKYMLSSDFMQDGKLITAAKSLNNYNAFLEIQIKSFIISVEDNPERLVMSELGNQFLAFIENESINSAI